MALMGKRKKKDNTMGYSLIGKGSETKLQSMRSWTNKSSGKGKPSKLKKGGGMTSVKTSVYGTPKKNPGGKLISEHMIPPKRGASGATKKKGGKDPWSLKNPALAIFFFEGFPLDFLEPPKGL